MDNKEHNNFTQPFIDFLLFLATGAERGRSRQDGSMRVNRSRPVGVITSIEGVFKAELQARCFEVRYALCDGPRLPRAAIEREIRERRHEITAALARVFRRYMEIKDEPLGVACPVPDFEEHYTTLANLLRAYGHVAGKPPEWSESIISVWGKVVAEHEPEEDYLEYRISSILSTEAWEIDDPRFRTDRIWKESVTHDGKRGTLYVTECGYLLDLLKHQDQRDQHLPRTPIALGRRLRSARFRAFTFLDQDSAPDRRMLTPTAKSRPVGFFVEDDK